jgi:hypothetical protein
MWTKLLTTVNTFLRNNFSWLREQRDTPNPQVPTRQRETHDEQLESSIIKRGHGKIADELAWLFDPHATVRLVDHAGVVHG